MSSESEERAPLLKWRGLVRCFDAGNVAVIACIAIVFLTAQGTVWAKNEFEGMRAKSYMLFLDFSKYYICGKMASGDDYVRANVYDANLQQKYLTEYSLTDAKKPIEYIAYPPINFPLMKPLALLPMSQAFHIYWTLGLAFSIGATWLLSRQSIFFRGPLNFLTLWLAIFASIPMFRAYALGQFSLYLLGLIALYFYFFLRQSKKLDWSAGATLALTAIKPQYCIFLAIPALATFRWRILIAAAAGEAVLLALAAATVGIKNIIDFPKIVLFADQTSLYSGVFPEQMVNLRAIFCLFTAPHLAMKIASALGLAAMVALAWLWYKHGRKRSDLMARLVALTVCVCLTTSPHTNVYDCILLCIPALLTMPSSFSASLYSRFRSLETKKHFWPEELLTLTLLLYAPVGWLIFLLAPGKNIIGEASITLPFAFINMLLCALQCVCLRHESSAAASRSTVPKTG